MRLLIVEDEPGVAGFLEQDLQGSGYTVDVYIDYLRWKIDHGFDSPLIQTIRGVGYWLSEAKDA